MIVVPERDFVAIGVLAGHLRVSVRSIEDAAQQLGLSPAMRINNIAHFDGEQVEAILGFLRSRASGSTIANLAKNLQ